jgi:hypothetical protein
MSAKIPVAGILVRSLQAMPADRWFAIRRAQNRKPATYRCPLCGRHLPALSEHMLIVPEGDSGRRRHAHTKCVMEARKAGRLPTRSEWLASQPGEESAWKRLMAWVSGRLSRG